MKSRIMLLMPEIWSLRGLPFGALVGTLTQVKSILTLWPLRESARAALIQGGMTFARPQDREQAADLLAQKLLWNIVRYFPMALRAVRQIGGAEVETQVLERLSRQGFIAGEDPRPDTPQEFDQRRTPVEVRTLWTPCREAYDRVFTAAIDGCDDHRIPTILALSWALHTFSYALVPFYKDWVHDIRRRQALGEEITINRLRDV